MYPRAIFFGAIGSLTETAAIELRAFNLAFAEAELDWTWDEDLLRTLRDLPNAAARIAHYARAQDEDVNVAEIADAQVSHYEDLVMDKEILPRPGVRELIDWSQSEDILLGLTTTGAPQNVSFMLGGLAPEVLRSDFDFIGDAEQVNAPKPAAEIYRVALNALGVLPSQSIAIEATPEDAQTARAAGLRTIGFPDIAAEHRTFPDGVPVAQRLTRALILGPEG